MSTVRAALTLNLTKEDSRNTKYPDTGAKGRNMSEVNHEEVLALAERFHEAYERLAPLNGYRTREETRRFDPNTPNGRTMMAVCAELMTPPDGAQLDYSLPCGAPEPEPIPRWGCNGRRWFGSPGMRCIACDGSGIDKAATGLRDFRAKQENEKGPRL
jgi:hypothetical protein